MSIQPDIGDWLHGRPDWQQEAASRILKSGTLSEADLDEITALCKTATGQKKTKTRTFSAFTSYAPATTGLHLSSVGDVTGIENLAPKKPLSFGSGNLTVIYGNNGSGKSGYTRILKKACGKRHAVDLRSNVFKSPPPSQACTISFTSNGSPCSVKWDPSHSSIPELAAVDIFDTDCGKFYLGKENQASYIPGPVQFFDCLVKVCEGVRQRLQNEIDSLPSKLPAIPTALGNTVTASFYKSLKRKQSETALSPVLVWTEDDKEALRDTQERLGSDDPSKVAGRKKAQKVVVDGLLDRLTVAIEKLSMEDCNNILDAKTAAVAKRTVAMEAAKAMSDSDCLAGVGGQTWRALWEAARQYSTVDAYENRDFPVSEDGAKCVFCQQILSPEAQQRLRAFEEFVTGNVENAARAAEKARDGLLEALPVTPTDEELQIACQAAGLDTDVWLLRLKEVWGTVELHCESLRSSSVAVKGINITDYSWLEELRVRSKILKRQIDQHEADAVDFDRLKTTKQRDELLARQWTSQQKTAVMIEVERLEKVEKLQALMAAANPAAISKQAGIVAEKLITEAYIGRFNDELAALGAKRLKVELVKTRVAKGKAMHGIRLRGLATSGITPPDVLSEGERRIVELAAFLADVTGKTGNAPFIFDDPISSLDQSFEEKTIERLITLSETRQVLIFTHRLSFLGMLSDKTSPETIGIRHEPWGAGEPGSVPIFGKKPENALKGLRDERVKQAEKLLNQDGSEAYYPLAKGICSDLRILIERVVELDFLADVIQRHRREVHTKGKISKLTRINSGDCELIDKFMSKYSCYEHSQSLEAPVEVPLPDVLAADITELLTWHAEFKGRM